MWADRSALLEQDSRCTQVDVPVALPPQMAKYAQILAGKHWREVLGDDGLLQQTHTMPLVLSQEAMPHNAWQASAPHAEAAHLDSVLTLHAKKYPCCARMPALLLGPNAQPSSVACLDLYRDKHAGTFHKLRALGKAACCALQKAAGSALRTSMFGRQSTVGARQSVLVDASKAAAQPAQSDQIAASENASEQRDSHTYTGDCCLLLAEISSAVSVTQMTLLSSALKDLCMH